MKESDEKKLEIKQNEQKPHYVLEVQDSTLGQVTITGKENEDGKSSS